MKLKRQVAFLKKKFDKFDWCCEPGASASIQLILNLNFITTLLSNCTTTYFTSIEIKKIFSFTN